MPIYEYLCSKCGNRFEKKQSFSASTIDECPICHHDARRVISKTSFILKGSGWYATDHPSSTRAKANKAAPSETSSDPKPTSSNVTETPKAGGDNSNKAA